VTDRLDPHAQIIARYRRVANLPDGLFFFTFPFRWQAVRQLRLAPGGTVPEVGCGSGVNFPFLVRAVGPAGQVVGVDLSPDLIAAASARVRRRGWPRVRLIELAAESLRLDEKFDALLLFAMHDVFTSPAGLDRCLAHVRPGGRVVAVGPVLAAGRPGRVLNPVLGAVFRRFAVSSLDRYQPWRLLAERVPALHVERFGPGVLFMAWGEVS
jgi:demethylmenaquinone methyltransferase/2-methoxy-6-polyprenyl-1,4-benzoquinol methylase